MSAPKRLPLVRAGDEMAGDGPLPFERLARTVKAGSRDHRGLVTTVATVARRAVSSAVPPSVSRALVDGIDGALAWARGDAASKTRDRRATVFAALPVVERAAVDAVEKMLGAGPPDTSPLARHADHVVLRYVSLAAHFATSAVCHALDAIDEPIAALEVPRDVIGAYAYQRSGLGAARQADFRARALEQATWEAGRETSRRLHHEMDALAPQIFHEYLGARWRTLAASERSVVEAFLVWALEGGSGDERGS